MNNRSWSYIFLIVFTLVFCAIGLSTIPQTCSRKTCMNGVCLNDTCLCEPGWMGPKCDYCNGRFSLIEPSGIIHDGSGNYTLNATCTWLIHPEQNSSLSQYSIKLTFHSFLTECGWDHFYVFDGTSIYSPLLASLSGPVRPGTELTLNSGSAYLYFYSDLAFTLGGFNITYRYVVCPNDCSSHGTCNTTSQDCVCDTGWNGESCSTPDTPCPNNCSNIGECSNGTCICPLPYSGTDCSLAEEPTSLQWRPVQTANTPPGRASAAVTYLNDAMYMIGGELMTNRFIDPTAKNISLYRLSLSSLSWEELPPLPMNVEGDWVYATLTADAYLNTLYFAGGEINGQVTDECWTYNITSSTWQRLTPIPVAVKNHAAHLVGQKLILLMGYNPSLGYLAGLQEYDTASGVWTERKTLGGVVVFGRYGFSSVYQSPSNSIYIHGGYYPVDPRSTIAISRATYSLNLTDYTWSRRLSGNAVYLHSSTLWRNSILTFGGNPHNESSRVDICYSDRVTLYDTCCQEWVTLPVDNVGVLDLSRYGHSMFTDDAGDVYVYGGFNGILLGDLIKLYAPTCQSHQSETSCSNQTTVNGSMCEWDHSANECVEAPVSTSCQRTCSKTPAQRDNIICQSISDCVSCNSSPQCEFLYSGVCRTRDIESTRFSPPYCNGASRCHQHTSCQLCNDVPECEWKGTIGLCGSRSTGSNATSSDCGTTCSQFSSCSNCTSARSSCLWCESQQACVPSNTYLVNFHYGHCLDWVTFSGKCSDVECSERKECGTCQLNPQCGWCNHEENTGLGSCSEGALAEARNGTACSSDKWYFEACPACQCNGHSTCDGNGVCFNCTGNTTGDNCESCAPGFYGDARNGGSCQPCDCGNVADMCDALSGACHCKVQGNIGARCTRCDPAKRYSWSSYLQQCYYPVGVNFKYSFNFSKAEDCYVTSLNLQASPEKDDKDVDLTIACLSTTMLNLSLYSEAYGDSGYKNILVNRWCYADDLIKLKLRHDQYPFGITKHNATFLIQMYDFTTPFYIQVTFSQLTQIDLFRFFLVFFGCFLALLVIAGVIWKLRIKYYQHVFRQRLREERQNMASRPMRSLLIPTSELKPIEGWLEVQHPNLQSQISTIGPSETGIFAHTFSKRKRRSDKIFTPKQATVIGSEPLASNRATVYTVLMKLPTGDDDTAGIGQCGLALASALVSINPQSNHLTKVSYKSNTGRITLRRHSANQEPI